MSNEVKTRLIPLTKWNQYHPWPSIGGLRHLVANSKEKKCCDVFIKAGGRWLIVEDAFFSWAYSSKEKQR
jgi:hypothetical protein